jgi:hypothetical protein
MIRALFLAVTALIASHSAPALAGPSDTFGPVQGYIPPPVVQHLGAALDANPRDEALLYLYLRETYCSDDWLNYRPSFVTHGLDGKPPNHLRAGFPAHAAAIRDFETCADLIVANIYAVLENDNTEAIRLIEEMAEEIRPLLVEE